MTHYQALEVLPNAYRRHRSEVNRRLHELALRRVLDQTAEVVRLAATIALP